MHSELNTRNASPVADCSAWAHDLPVASGHATIRFPDELSMRVSDASALNAKHNIELVKRPDRIVEGALNLYPMPKAVKGKIYKKNQRQQDATKSVSKERASQLMKAQQRLRNDLGSQLTYQESNSRQQVSQDHYVHGSTPLVHYAPPTAYKKAMWTMQNTPRRWHEDGQDITALGLNQRQ